MLDLKEITILMDPGKDEELMKIEVEEIFAVGTRCCFASRAATREKCNRGFISVRGCSRTQIVLAGVPSCTRSVPCHSGARCLAFG